MSFFYNTDRALSLFLISFSSLQSLKSGYSFLSRYTKSYNVYSFCVFFLADQGVKSINPAEHGSWLASTNLNSHQIILYIVVVFDIMLGIVHQIASYCYVKKEQFAVACPLFLFRLFLPLKDYMMYSGKKKKKAAMRRPSDIKKKRYHCSFANITERKSNWQRRLELCRFFYTMSTWWIVRGFSHCCFAFRPFHHKVAPSYLLLWRRRW